VEIEDKKPLSWLPVIPAESSWKNPTFNKVFTETPGFQGIHHSARVMFLKESSRNFRRKKKKRRS
jgi:hypothetical protein